MAKDLLLFKGQLADLKSPSKPAINLLTMMAEDYLRHSATVVHLVEKRLATVRPQFTLPILYLIDSIIKNVKKEYVILFTQNIVSTFGGVYDRVNEETRTLMWKLRESWSGHFHEETLYAIDLRCHEIDERWPMRDQPPPTGSIYVNPQFLKGKGEEVLLNSGEHILPQALLETPVVGYTSLMDTSALTKQKELLELRTKQVEMELLQTKLQLEDKARLQKATKQYNISLAHERVLFGMAETAQNPMELIQQQLFLSTMHPKAPSTINIMSDRRDNNPLKRKLKDQQPENELYLKKKDNNNEKQSKEKAMNPIHKQDIDERWNLLERKDYRERQQAVLKRSYRKNQRLDAKDDMSAQEALDMSTTTSPFANISDVKPGDVNLTFGPLFDVDWRDQTDGSGPEPLPKKIMPESRSMQFELADPFFITRHEQNGPSPWVTGTQAESNTWESFCNVTAASVGADSFSGGYPGNSTPWGTPKTNIPWITDMTMPPAPTGPNPFEEAIARPLMVNDFIPKASQHDLRVAEQNVGRTIPINDVGREIRFYREATIVMTGINGDVPRDLTFQEDDLPRTILINGKPLKIYLGQTKKFDLNRVTHRLKIGPPGHELCIDDKRHDLIFGGPPKHIFIGNRRHSFQFLPPSPQVSVGSVPRYDLCAGKVTLTIDAMIVPLFLDDKLQKIEIGREPVVLRFCNGFKAVTLNGRQFPSNFGLPFSITLPNSELHFLRFNAVSPDIELGMQNFVNARCVGEWNENRNNSHFGGRGGRGGVGRGSFRGRRVIARGRPRDTSIDVCRRQNPWTQDGGIPLELPSNPNSLDLLNNQSLVEGDTKISEKGKSGDSGTNLNVNDLFASLLKAGLLPAAPIVAEGSVIDEPVEKIDKKSQANQKSYDKKEEYNDGAVVAKSKPTIPPLPTVDVSFDDNLKERRDVAIRQLTTGLQCSQCGLRFPPDQTLRYSQHLDAHFRQNRQKALNREWYFDLSDWIKFVGNEDLEEPAASLFEHQDAQGSDTALNPEDFTVLASTHDGAVCPHCGESFESYFDEEREEWRIKNSKLDEYEGEEKLYHPVCHQDYLRCLVEESVTEEDTEITDAGGDNKENEDHSSAPMHVGDQEEDDEVLIIKEGKKEVVVMEIDIDEGKNHSPVNVLVNEEEDGVTDEENYNAENDCVKDCAGNFSLENNATRSSIVQSPILIDEDSDNFLPGLCDEAEGGVFGFALGSGCQREKSTDLLGVEGKRIIYESMKFDMPPIKLEPVDEEMVDMDTEAVPDDFMSNLQPFLTSSFDKGPGDTELMNIDLTEEDSTDAVDSGARLVTQMRTSIDGNLQHEETAILPFVPAPKIRINLSDVRNLSKPTNKGKEIKDKVESPLGPNHGSENEIADSQEQGFVMDDVSSNNIVSETAEINKCNPIDPILTEEIERLKPHLVGRKLTNLPLKSKGKVESALCIIC